jgi:hypothetical protein
MVPLYLEVGERTRDGSRGANRPSFVASLVQKNPSLLGL